MNLSKRIATVLEEYVVATQIDKATLAIMKEVIDYLQEEES